MEIRSVLRVLLLTPVLLFSAITPGGCQMATAVHFIPEVRFCYSYIQTQESLTPYFGSKYFPLFELSLYRETFGLNRWEILYKYPRKGIMFFHSAMGGAPTGNVLGAVPFINFPLIRDDKWMTSFRAGMGIAYFNKSFRYSNEDGLIIAEASKLNAAIVLGPQFTYSATKKLSITGGLTLYHLNNAGYKTPGYFFNIPSAYIGVSYIFGKGEVTPISQPLARPRKKWKTILWGGIGYKTLVQQGKYYLPYTISMNASRYLSSKWRIGITGDAFNDITIYHKKAINGEKATKALAQRYGSGLNFTWVIGALEVPFDFGVYIFPAYPSDGSFYNRLGLRYFFHKNVFLNTTLKTHFFKPDHFEGGIGVAF